MASSTHSLCDDFLSSLRTVHLLMFGVTVALLILVHSSASQDYREVLSEIQSINAVFRDWESNSQKLFKGNHQRIECEIPPAAEQIYEGGLVPGQSVLLSSASEDIW